MNTDITLEFAENTEISADTLDLSLLTKATREELEEAIEDEYGVKYSKDGKRLLRAPQEYAVPEGTKVICDGAFKWSQIRRIHIPSSVTSIGVGAFKACWYIKVDDNNPNYTSVDDVLYSKDMTVLVQCLKRYGDFVIPSSVISICDEAFYGCEGLTSVTIPNNVTEIGKEAFMGCWNLDGIDIPNSVTKIGVMAFHCCDGIESIYIPSSVKEIGFSAFASYNLEKIVVDKNNPKYDSREGCNAIICTEKGKITLVAGCCNTRIPNSVTRIGEYAFDRTAIAKIDIPQSVTEIERGAFNGCYELESISIPDSVTKLSCYVFSCCRNLKNVHLPNSITEIGDDAFLGCESLTDFCIPDGVKKIESLAFNCCYGLKTIHLPNSVRKIGKDIFRRCDKLEKIYIPYHTKDKFAKLLPDYKHLLEEKE